MRIGCGSSAGVAPNPSVPGSVYDIAILNTNTSPTSTLGLKEGADFTVSSTFSLTPPPSGDYGMELTDGTATHGVDQLVRMIVTESGGQTVVELVQADLIANQQAYNIIASQTLTAAQPQPPSSSQPVSVSVLVSSLETV